MSKVVLITGASSGIGKSAANMLHNQGYTVYGAARRLEQMQDLKEKGMFIVPLDLTKEESIVSCVNTILEKEGRIDALINNAGYGSLGAIEDVPIEEAKRQFEVNIFGLSRITQLVLPKMREHKFGRIVNISSVGGKIYTPFGAWYHATKHALEGLSDCLRLELKPFGIDVSIIEPGGIKTEWGIIAAENLRKISEKGAYSTFSKKVANRLEEAYSNNSLSNVEVIGNIIAKAVTSKKPKTRYVKGYMATSILFARRWFSNRFYDKMIIREFNR